jgi:hypothetical protein
MPGSKRNIMSKESTELTSLGDIIRHMTETRETSCPQDYTVYIPKC